MSSLKQKILSARRKGPSASAEAPARRGDTLIEVVLAFAIFSTVTAIAIAVMNSSITSAEAALELTLARQEIDAQAETLRYIHNSFLNDRELAPESQPYRDLWIAIRSLATSDASVVPKLSDQVLDCSQLYDAGTGYGSGTLFNLYTAASPNAKAFVLNTRKIVASSDTTSDEYYGHTLITAGNDPTATRYFYAPSLNPRIVYTNGTDTTDDTLAESNLGNNLTPAAPYDEVARVEGIWDIIVRENVAAGVTSNFYDFHIYTCWFPPGAARPSTIGTVVRLYNPEYIEESYF